MAPALFELLLWGSGCWCGRTSCSGWLYCVQAWVALVADHLVTIVILDKVTKGWLDDATVQTQHQVQGGLFLDVVVGQGVAILQLFASEYQLCWSMGCLPCLGSLLMVSLGSISRVMVLPIRVFMKICMLASATWPPRWRERAVWGFWVFLFVCFAFSF